MGNRQRGRFSSGPKRSMFWEGALVDLSNATGVNTVATVIAEANFEEVPNPTIVRIRGYVNLRATVVGAGDARTQIRMGIIVVTAKAFAAGVASIPVPGTDIGSDWMWWDTRTLVTESATPSEDTGIGLNRSVEVDNKAMRKVGLNQLLVFVVENTGLNSSITVQTTASLRVLIKR